MTNRTPGEALAALSKAVLAITAASELETVLRAVVDSARVLVGSRYAATAVLRTRGDGGMRFVASGLDAEVIRAIGSHPEGRGVLGVVRAEGRPVRLADIGADPRAVGFPPHHPVMTSFLGVPIASADGHLGELYVADKIGSAAFDADDQGLLEVFATHAAQAITNARVFQCLSESEQRYRLLTQGAPEVVFALDRVGRITFMNDRLTELTGADPDSIRGHLLRDMVVPEDRSVVDLHLRSMRSGAARTAFDVSATDLNGEPLHFEISLVPSAGPGADFQGIARDVTEQRAVARQFSERTSELLSSRQERRRLREFVSLVIQAQEDERARIAGDLHDTTVQTLTAIGRRLFSLAANGLHDTDALREELTELAKAAMAEGEEVRRLSRNLRPSVLDHLGLAAGLEHLVGDLRATGLRVAMTVNGDASRLDDQQRTALFRIAQEALRNVRRHSGASLVEVMLSVGASEAALSIKDNGLGFDTREDSDELPGSSPHLGLAGMRERAAMLGGWLIVTSAPGAGTEVSAGLPLNR